MQQQRNVWRRDLPTPSRGFWLAVVLVVVAAGFVAHHAQEQQCQARVEAYATTQQLVTGHAGPAALEVC